MKKYAIAFMLFLSACGYKNPLADFRFQTVPAPPYIMSSWHKINEPGQALYVYIDDDEPSDFMRTKATKDKNPNVAYLGRPCQYLQTDACPPNNPFSTQIVTSMETSVKSMMKKARTNHVYFVTFGSGTKMAEMMKTHLINNIQDITEVKEKK